MKIADLLKKGPKHPKSVIPVPTKTENPAFYEKLGETKPPTDDFVIDVDTVKKIGSGLDATHKLDEKDENFVLNKKLTTKIGKELDGAVDSPTNRFKRFMAGVKHG